MKPSAQCPFCEETVEILESDQGKTLQCPACRESYTVLGTEELEPGGLVPVLPHVAASPEAKLPDRWLDPLPGRRGTVRPWIRFWARTIEMAVWFQLLWSVIWLCSCLHPLRSWAIEHWNLSCILFPCAALLLWVPVEGLLLGSWGTTPGKWLLRFRVTHADGRPPSRAEAFRRSLHVWRRGMALGIGVLEQIAWILALFELRRKGRTRWDQRADLIVTHHRIGLLRGFFAWLVLLAPQFMAQLMRVLWPVIE